MQYLKQVLILFFVIDIFIFLAYQINPQMLAGLFPQFNINGDVYQRLLGILALTFAVIRLCAALNIGQKKMVVISLWSWIIELFFIISEIFRGTFNIVDNIPGLLAASIMIVWTVLYINKYLK